MAAIVVVPTCHERQNRAELLAGIQRYAKNCHVLIVDDNAPDGTGDVADALQNRYPGSVFVIHREKK